MSSLDVATMLSSKSDMKQGAYKQQYVFNVLKPREHELQIYAIEDETYNQAANVFQVMEKSALLMIGQSGCTYAKLSETNKDYNS